MKQKQIDKSFLSAILPKAMRLSPNKHVHTIYMYVKNQMCFVAKCLQSIIRKTCPCNIYPLKPHFYIVKLGYAGVYLFFLFLLRNIDCGYSLELPQRGGSNVYPQSMF